MKAEDVIRLIGICTREVLSDLEKHEFRPSDQLAELGANSVDRAEIVMLVVESLSLTVPRTQLFGPKNIGELADLLVEKVRDD